MTEDNNSIYSNSSLADVTAWVKDGSGCYTKGRTGAPEGQSAITNVTLHIVATDWNAETLAGWSRWGQASSHYGIASDGTIVQLVDEKDTAWTNGGNGVNRIPNPLGEGNVGFNNNSVTMEISNLIAPGSGEGYFTASNGQEYHYKNGKVEMNGEYYTYPITNEALDSTIRLVADIAKRNNLGELYHDGYKGTLTWHSDFPDVYKPCPGDYVKAMTNYICESANEINEKGFYIPDYSISSQSGNGLMQIVTAGENPFEDGTISSSMYTVVDSVNKIRGSISGNESISATQNPSVSSSSTIPAELINAHSSLFSISSDLLSTLNQETKIIASVAQTYFEMDQYLSSQASNLSDGGANVDTSIYDAKVAELMSTDLSSTLSFSAYMFSPSSHSEGNSGKICLSDINSMLSGNSLTGALAENLNSERESAAETKTQINSLIQNITSHNELKGSAWDQVAVKLETYSALMDTRIESCNIMEAATVKALKLIKDYMGEYEELDDSKLPELRQKVVQLKQDIETAQNIINATKQVTHTYVDSNGKTQSYTTTEYVYSAAARKEAMATIERAEKLIIEYEKEIAKLEGLPVILAQAEQIMNDALSEIYNKYGVKVSDVVTGKEASFVPPANTSYSGTYTNNNKPYEVQREIPEGKVSREQFDQSLGLQNEYGTYNDYLNGVKVKDNPMYNPSLKDNGLNLDGTPNLDNENGEETPSDTVPEEENDTNQDDSNSDNSNVDNNDTEDNDSGNNNTGNNDSGNNDSGNNNSGNNDSGNNNSGNNNSGNNNTGNNDSGNNDSGNNNTGNTDSGNNDSGNDNTGNNDSGNNDSGNNNTGNNNSGNNDSGNDNPGNNDTGNNDSGNNDTGNNDSGNNDSGNNDTGNNDSGNNDSGNNNTENNNFGNSDSGNTDSGNDNTGNNDSGNNDSGNDNTGNNNTGNNDSGNNDSGNNDSGNTDNSTGSNSGNNESQRPNSPSIDSNVNPMPSVPDTDVSDGVVEDLPVEDTVPDTEVEDSVDTIPPVVEIPDDEIIDITPEDVYQNDNADNSNETSDLAKKIAIGVGVGAVAGAAALGAHTYSKAKKNNIYEED